MEKYICTNNILNETIWQDILSNYSDNAQKLQNHPINKNKYNKYSQNGEDGILEYILNKIGFKNKVCIEFGAIDGIKFSNTAMLHDKYKFQRFLIEGNPNAKNNTTNEDIIHELITPQNINTILDKAGCPMHVDLLSIDIDGDDYWVWKAMKHQARVVIIEYHPAIPNDNAIAIIPSQTDISSHNVSYPFPNTYTKKTNRGTRLNGYYGANLKAMFKLAKSKGYEFCTTIADNAIFVLKDEFPKLEIPSVDLEECIRNYFIPSQYWFKHRDKFNRSWMIVD